MSTPIDADEPITVTFARVHSDDALAAIAQKGDLYGELADGAFRLLPTRLHELELGSVDYWYAQKAIRMQYGDARTVAKMATDCPSCRNSAVR